MIQVLRYVTRNFLIMKKFQKTLLLSVLILFASLVQAQEKRFYMPLEIQKAYEKDTRSWTGEPGPGYWHNTVDYKINVSIDPSNRGVTGSEEVTYYNNSPDDLNVLVIRLYHNVFKKGNPRLMSVNSDDINDGVEVSELIVNGEEYSFEGQEVQSSGTNLLVRLRQPLESGKSLTFSCNWKQEIPLTVRRTGAIDSTSYFVAYWYPQVAVYDDVFGWDRMNYTFHTEFYNNLGNYDVTINAPESFTVWATGELQNAKDVLNKNVYKRYNEARKSTETVNLITANELEDGFKHKSGSWHYVASGVSDFAFAMSDHYLWDAAVQQVADRQVFISSVFPSAAAERYTEHTQLQRKSMQHMSEDVPGVPYPYPAFTTFIGLRGGGMEFPMMANNADEGRGVTIHEMFHTYFPMYVRINERRFAWMDEGWADFVTARLTNLYFEENDLPPYAGPKGSMEGVIGTIGDLPLITSSQFMDNSNYGYASYPLPSFIYGVLNDYLGEEMFLKCLRTYIDRWKTKSPTPYDFFYSFENVSGEDLSWLWNPWFFEYGYPDVRVKSLDGKMLTVENTGTKPVPLSVHITYEDGTEARISENAKIWASGNIQTVEIENHENVSRIIVNKEIPDMTALENFFPTLREIYADVEVPSDAVGDYRLNEFPVTANIKEMDGIFL